MTYDMWRKDGGPTLYGPLKSAVTADVLEAGFLFAMAILIFSLLITLPGIRGGSEKLFAFIKMMVGVFVLVSIMLCNFGQEWEVSELTTNTQYRAGLREEIHAHIGVKIGLRSINVTLKADPEETVTLDHGRVNETINYNERFSWNNQGFTIGRAGFGPLAGRFNREFRAAQRRGTPYPILWVAEYFTIDGEGIRWGRHYLQAGFYTHVLMWLALPLWIISVCLYYMVLRYGAYFTIMTGGCMLLGNILWATIRNRNELVIPFEEGNLNFKWGWCFWLCLINGIILMLIGLVILFLDHFKPEALGKFFSHDTSKDFEAYYVDPKELERLRNRAKSRKRSFFPSRSPASSPPEEEASYRTTGNGHSAAPADDDDELYDSPPAARPVQRMYRKQTILGPRIVSKHPLKAPMPVPRGTGAARGSDDDDLYVNAGNGRRHPQEHENQAFDNNQV